MTDETDELAIQIFQYDFEKFRSRLGGVYVTAAGLDMVKRSYVTYAIELYGVDVAYQLRLALTYDRVNNVRLIVSEAAITLLWMSFANIQNHPLVIAYKKREYQKEYRKKRAAKKEVKEYAEKMMSLEDYVRFDERIA